MAFVFRAKSLSDLRIDEANKGRIARQCKIAVAVESQNGTWFELDADDKAHAETLARNIVDNGSARGASCWAIDRNGCMSGRSLFNYYAN